MPLSGVVPLLSRNVHVEHGVAYAAAVWAFVFACFHVVWALGWYPLLDAEGARAAFATP